jgi:hypothetical protein
MLLGLLLGLYLATSGIQTLVLEAQELLLLPGESHGF